MSSASPQRITDEKVPRFVAVPTHDGRWHLGHDTHAFDLRSMTHGGATTDSDTFTHVYITTSNGNDFTFSERTRGSGDWVLLNATQSEAAGKHRYSNVSIDAQANLTLAVGAPFPLTEEDEGIVTRITLVNQTITYDAPPAVDVNEEPERIAERIRAATKTHRTHSTFTKQAS